MRGLINACTCGFDSATSGVTLLGKLLGNSPFSCSSCCTISSYACIRTKKERNKESLVHCFDYVCALVLLTFKGLICKFKFLCSINSFILSDNTAFKYDWPGPLRV
jgi:hypothetical protein